MKWKFDAEGLAFESRIKMPQKQVVEERSQSMGRKHLRMAFEGILV